MKPVKLGIITTRSLFRQESEIINEIYKNTNDFPIVKWLCIISNMKQVQPETLPKNSNFSSCLQNIKLKNNTIHISPRFLCRLTAFMELL